MKAVLIYWVLGCVIVGVAAGLRKNECPAEKMPTYEYVATVAIWPIIFSAALVMKGPVRKIACEAI